jgi:hypothetical protein
MCGTCIQTPAVHLGMLSGICLSTYLRTLPPTGGIHRSVVCSHKWISSDGARTECGAPETGSPSYYKILKNKGDLCRTARMEVIWVSVPHNPGSVVCLAP